MALARYCLVVIFALFLIDGKVTTNDFNEAISDLKDEVDELIEGIDGRLQRLENQPPVESAHVAFSARLTGDVTTEKDGTAYAYEGLVFSHVYVNIGEGYNSSDGVFTCPVGGLYIFTVNVFSAYTYKMWTMLEIDGTYTVASRSTSNTNYNKYLSAYSLLLACGSGGRVQVHGAGNVYGGLSPQSTFTGLLLDV